MQAPLILLAALIGSSVAVTNSFPSRHASERIVGGTLAAEGAAPHQASIRNYGNHRCGGSIIDTRWILTAAHCVTNIPTRRVLTVHVGTNRSDKLGVQYSVTKSIIHCEYNENRLFNNDVALLLLTTDIKYTPLIQPIALDRAGTLEGSSVTLYGWGVMSLHGYTLKRLRTIQLSTISYAECKNRWAETKRDNILETHICTLTKKGEGSCQGDSGGALTQGGKVIGIVSFGFPSMQCAEGYPDVFTRVSSFVDWIDKKKH